MYRPSIFRDPAQILEDIQDLTCKGRPHETMERFFGENQMGCGVGMPHGQRCENYGKRANMGVIDLFDAKPADDIDLVLVDWYEWSEAYTPATGYRTADASCREYRASRHG